MTDKNEPTNENEIPLPTLEEMQRELGSAKSIDDFFGKEGIFARLFSKTLEHMLEGELTSELGYEKYEAKGRRSGNSRNGHYRRRVKTSGGESEIAVPRDRNGEFEPKILHKYETSSNELEDKIVTLYSKGMTTSDIRTSLNEMYGMDVSEATISAVTDKVWPLVEAWQNRPLAACYPLVYLDAIVVKLRRDSRIENVAVHIVLGVDLEGRKDALGHWIGDGAEGATSGWGFCETSRRVAYRISSSPAWMGCPASAKRSRRSFLRPWFSAASCTRSATASNTWSGKTRTSLCAI